MAKKLSKGVYKNFIKGPQDVLLASLALLVLWPIMLVVAVLVKCKLGSPVIFKQQRAGKNGEAYWMYKFRSMTDTRDEHGELLPDEQRLGNFGKWLRSTSLDELPSLWNVVRGEVALVGPRSLHVRYNELYNEEQARRLEVRPGVTGLAQINGRNAISWEERFKYDVQYVDNITFVGDWTILLKTINKVFKREGITSATSSTMEEFTGTKTAETINNSK